MKKAIQILAIVLIVTLPMFLAAQPQPWDPGVGGGEGANPVGAPIGGGLLIWFPWPSATVPRRFSTLVRKCWNS